MSNDFINKMKKVLTAKEIEYAHGGDRYHNFKVAGSLLMITPLNALLGMQVKHIVSVMDMLKSNVAYPEKIIDEKIGDSFNYCMLAAGLVSDQNDLTVVINNFEEYHKNRNLKVSSLKVTYTYVVHCGCLFCFYDLAYGMLLIKDILYARLK